MLKRRLLVGSLSSLLWPAVVLVIPAGITFAAARVYAESSVLYECDSGVVQGCADAAVYATCSLSSDGVSQEGLCIQRRCVDYATNAAREALVCQRFTSCPLFRDECLDKAEGTPCQGGRCTVVKDACFEIVGDAGVLKDSMYCRPDDPPGSVVDSGTGGARDASTTAQSSAMGKDDSGCAASPGSGSGFAALLGAPLALGLLLARRRQASRKEPSARKRS